MGTFTNELELTAYWCPFAIHALPKSPGKTFEITHNLTSGLNYTLKDTRGNYDYPEAVNGTYTCRHILKVRCVTVA